MVYARRRTKGPDLSWLLSSVLLSLLASAAATFLLRQFVSAATRPGGGGQEGEPGRGNQGNVNVTVPVIVVTVGSGNRSMIGRRGMPPPFFLPFLVARIIRAKRRGRPRAQRRMPWQ
jgi:hypothetical protein